MKKVLIVGASSGIGEALKKMIQDSWELISISRNESPDSGPDELHFSQDILSSDPLPQLEHLDALVYCPGSIVLKPFHRMKMEEFQADWELNVAGAIKVLQAYYPALKKSESASVVLFSTVAATKGMSFHASIASSKAAIEGLTKSLAAEWAPQIRVNAIAPSLTNTRLAEGLLNTEVKMQASRDRHPLKRIGDPIDIAAMAKFLISEEASWISGQILHVDGGMSI